MAELRLTVKDQMVGRKHIVTATGHSADVEAWASDYEQKYPYMGYATKRNGGSYDPKTGVSTVIIERWTTD